MLALALVNINGHTEFKALHITHTKDMIKAPKFDKFCHKRLKYQWPTSV